MTLCTAWIRKNKSSEELMIVTDSRLRSYGSWDCNPKIFTFSRTDCAMCFAGDTAFAYPMMIQIMNSINNNPKTKSRFQRLSVFKSIIIKTMNSMLQYKSDYELPEAQFIFAGYCWHESEFKIWKIRYNKLIEKFTSHTIKYWSEENKDKKVIFIGDYVNEAQSRLTDKLRSKGKIEDGSFEMEPFEVIRDLLNESKDGKTFQAIGGAPQLIKIYKHLNRVPIAVKWNINGKEKTTLLGNPIETDNNIFNPILDPETLALSNTNKFNNIS